MMAGESTGEIEGLHTEVNVLWKIPDYFSSQKTDTFYDSPSFHFSGSTWSLRIYPNGERYNKSVEFVGLYVRRVAEYEKHSVNFTIGIVYGNDIVREKKSYMNGNFSVGRFLGWDKFIERQILLKKKTLTAPHGTLSIKFVGNPLHHDSDAASQTKILDGVSYLSRDFQALLSSEQKSDVAIKIKSRVFRAHKLILGARSVVFAAMFEHGMKENLTGYVDIVDCDPSIFHEFLLFIYTGKMDNLSSENVIGIFSLANKYDLSDLKQICIDFMEENLCLTMVCDILSVADKFNLASLKKSARKLLVDNIKSVMATENWIRFMRENPTLATEIFMTVIPDNSWRER